MKTQSTLHITSGSLRGQKIVTPKGSATHPMGSRERLALFNTLNAIRGPLTADTAVLDLFCGSGALGFEALSRGAGKVVFVDNSAAAIEAVKKSALSTKMEKSVELHRCSALEPARLFAPKTSDSARVKFASAATATASPTRFDLVFADPPYDHFPPDLTVLASFLKPGALLVLSHPKAANLSSLKNLELLATKSYAAANLSFFRAPIS